MSTWLCTPSSSYVEPLLEPVPHLAAHDKSIGASAPSATAFTEIWDGLTPPTAGAGCITTCRWMLVPLVPISGMRRMSSSSTETLAKAGSGFLSPRRGGSIIIGSASRTSCSASCSTALRPVVPDAVKATPTSSSFRPCWRSHILAQHDVGARYWSSPPEETTAVPLTFMVRTGRRGQSDARHFGFEPDVRRSPWPARALLGAGFIRRAQACRSSCLFLRSSSSSCRPHRGADVESARGGDRRGGNPPMSSVCAEPIRRESYLVGRSCKFIESSRIVASAIGSPYSLTICFVITEPRGKSQLTSSMTCPWVSFIRWPWL